MPAHGTGTSPAKSTLSSRGKSATWWLSSSALGRHAIEEDTLPVGIDLASGQRAKATVGHVQATQQLVGHGPARARDGGRAIASGRKLDRRAGSGAVGSRGAGGHEHVFVRPGVSLDVDPRGDVDGDPWGQ